MSAPGSSKLSDEQGDWFLKNHGARYTHVQANAGIASRKERRKRGQRSERAVTRMDVPR